uniref:curlin n=1 Tax=Ningiella ruwaisensis TaxID=2364274 RepID=UPI00109FA619|nr:curlin [Ningiella ruwaisensis]
MKYNKSIIASSLLLALSASHTVLAQETAAKESDVVVQADFMANATGNVIILTQSAPEGNEIGNSSSIFQEGDFNGADIEVIGIENTVDTVQIGSDNIVVGLIQGDTNEVSVYQEGLSSVTDLSITGNANIVSIEQLGDGGPFGFIFNRSINVIEGDGNELFISSGDGGNWSDNTVFGSGNAVDVTQTEDWHESYTTIFGDDNEISVEQGGFFTVSNVTLEGMGNEVNVDTDGDSNRVTISAVGDTNIFDFEQTGDDNTAETGIFTGSSNVGEITQLGNANIATMDTIDGIGNQFTIFQVGDGNEGYTGAIGWLNVMSVTQVGNGNLGSTVNFDGWFNTVEIEQTGDNNIALAEAGIGPVPFLADDNIISMVQEGNDNAAGITLATESVSIGNQIDIAQNGDLNLLDLVLNGNDASISIMQEGVGNFISAEDGSPMQLVGDAISFSVTQIGNDNLVAGSITGSGSVSITQIGDFNEAIVTQM